MSFSLTTQISANYTEAGAAVTLSGSASVTDTDAPAIVSAKLHISGGTFAGDGDLLAADTVGTSISASYDPTTETLTLTGVDTAAHYSQVFDSIVFSSTSQNPTNFGANPTRTVGWSVTDSNGTTIGPSNETVNITAINNRPILSTSTPTAFYGEHEAMVPISPGARISDPDSLTLASANLHIATGTFVGDGDVLAANVAGTNITASYNAATETLTLTGTDTVAHYQQVLDGVTFQSTSNNPGNFGANTTRTIDWTVDDGSVSNSTSTTTGFTTIAIMSLAVHQDFNADTMSDVLWRNSNGAIVEWALNGGNIAGSQQLASSPDPTTWSVAGIADFNHDREADILWRNSASGEVAIWFMNGSAIIGSGDANSGGVAVKPDASWSVAGVGDLNGDRNADIIWRNTSGEIAAWFMSGSTIIGSNDITNGGVAVKLDASWTMAGVGDLDGDGKRDLVWRNTSGEVAVWLMNGSAIASSNDITLNGLAVKPDSSWSIAGVGDFNGDGKADILWRNSSGALAEWLLNGNAITASLSIGTTPDASWNIVEVGDFDGNGKSDILWRQTGTGSLVEWSMNSSTILSSGAVGVPLNSSWQTQNKPTGFG